MVTDPDSWLRGVSDCSPSVLVAVDAPPDRPNSCSSSGDNDDDGDNDSDVLSLDATTLPGTVVSAGGSVSKYSEQLTRNGVEEISSEAFFDRSSSFGNRLPFDMETFSDENLSTIAEIHKGRFPDAHQNSLDRLRLINQDMQEGTIGQEWAYSTPMHGIFNETIEPGSVTCVKWRCDDIDSHRAMIWNHGPKYLLEAGYRDLSMPKVDSAYLISRLQDRTQDETVPLFSICRKVYDRDYCHQVAGTRKAWSDKPTIDRAVELLSLQTLRELHNYRETKEVSSCPITTVIQSGNYPVLFCIYKYSNELEAQCRNQVINGGVFLCGKQFDLVNLASSRKKGFFLDPMSIGITVTGREWQVYLVVFLPISVVPYSDGKPQMYAVKLANGNWTADPERMIGAIVASYEIMLEHTVRLLVTCFDILLGDVSTYAAVPPGEQIDTLPERHLQDLFEADDGTNDD